MTTKRRAFSASATRKNREAIQPVPAREQTYIPDDWEHHKDGMSAREIAGIRARNLRRVIAMSGERRRLFFDEMVSKYGAELQSFHDAVDADPPDSDCAHCGAPAGEPCAYTCETQFGPAYTGPLERAPADTVSRVYSYESKFVGGGVLLTVLMKDGRELDHFTFQPIPAVLWAKVNRDRYHIHAELIEALQFAYDIRGAVEH